MHRPRCTTCWQPEFSCFCQWLQPFDAGIDFMILTHPIEVKRRRIATGRMAHLSLKNSRFMMGCLFGEDDRVNGILRDINRQCFLLYPGRQSANLTEMPAEARAMIVPAGKRLTVFVIDGTWNTARKTVNQSPNLNCLPRICFVPPTPSNFRVRRQPRPECYSTIEAIHHTIELLGPAVGFNVESRRHDNLLSVFSKMVDRQIFLAGSGRPGRRGSGSIPGAGLNLQMGQPLMDKTEALGGCLG